jgi:hypothetical protein
LIGFFISDAYLKGVFLGHSTSTLDVANAVVPAIWRGYISGSVFTDDDAKCSVQGVAPPMPTPGSARRTATNKTRYDRNRRSYIVAESMIRGLPAVTFKSMTFDGRPSYPLPQVCLAFSFSLVRNGSLSQVESEAGRVHPREGCKIMHRGGMYLSFGIAASRKYGFFGNCQI